MRKETSYEICKVNESGDLEYISELYTFKDAKHDMQIYGNREHGEYVLSKIVNNEYQYSRHYNL